MLAQLCGISWNGLWTRARALALCIQCLPSHVQKCQRTLYQLISCIYFWPLRVNIQHDFQLFSAPGTMSTCTRIICSVDPWRPVIESNKWMLFVHAGSNPVAVPQSSEQPCRRWGSRAISTVMSNNSSCLTFTIFVRFESILALASSQYVQDYAVCMHILILSIIFFLKRNLFVHLKPCLANLVKMWIIVFPRLLIFILIF